VVKLNTQVRYKDDSVYLFMVKRFKQKNLIWAAGVSAMTFKEFLLNVMVEAKRMITDAYNKVNGKIAHENASGTKTSPRQLLVTVARPNTYLN
jgi:NADH dehydrogenase FAD-containing subunit